MTTGCGLLLLVAGPVPGGGEAGDWCGTMALWQAKAGGPVPVNGACPTEGDCDTAPVRDGFIPDDTTTVRTIRVHLVVFRDDSGGDPAATEQEIKDQMIRMNDDFAPSRLTFQYTWEYADDAQFRYGDDVGLMKELYAVSPERQCNVFVNNFNGGLGTFPWDPDALTALGGIVIGETLFGGDVSIISHEMGHNLGLYHAHRGATEVAGCGPCWEHADALDGDMTGDFCADTPPTPRNSECIEPGGIDQCSELPWGPTLPESYMSCGWTCWSLFTGQQAGRMRCWFASQLSGWLVTCPGDADGDGAVSWTDFQGLLAAWGTGDPAYDIAPPGGDGVVNIQDFMEMILRYGPCP